MLSVIAPSFLTFTLNTDISLDITLTELTFLTQVINIYMERTVSEILDLGFSFYFIKKRG